MPIIKKSFYYIRHGEAAFNPEFFGTNEPEIPLTPKGRNQASSVQKAVESLPIQTICVSPLRRALETKEIIAQNVQANVVVIPELEECNGFVWTKMIQIEDPSHDGIVCETVTSFMERAITGINKALAHPGPVLIVAHGGVHWAMCHRMGVKQYDKKMGNCVLAHFEHDEFWMGRHLAIPKV
jgi:uncharacterized phosphatase